MKNFWANKSLTIVVLPKTENSDVTEVMKSWAADRLLGNFLCVTPDRIQKINGQPAKVEAIVFGIDESGELKELAVDLFHELARNELNVVRLLAVQVLSGDSEGTVEFNKSLDYLAQYVEKSLPLPSSKDHFEVKRTRFFKINLLVAPTEAHQAQHQNAILDNWNINIVASPEDRSTPWSGDAFVRPGENFPTFIAMHIASIGGLWNGLGTGPFEIMERETSQQGTIWVSRVFVNAVLTDGLSRRVAARALQDIGDPSSEIFDQVIGIAIPGTVFIPEQDTGQWVEWMVEIVFGLDKKVLTFADPLAEESPPRERWFELQQIKNFFFFSWDKLKVIPWWCWIWLRRLVGRLLTNLFQGKTGKAVVGISQEDDMDSRDKLIIEKIKEINLLGQKARRALATPHMSASTMSNPELWRGIRNLVFSMLDASNRSEFVKEVDGQPTPVFSKVSQVVEDPRKKWKIEPTISAEIGIEEVSWSSLERLEEISECYKNRLNLLNDEKEGILKKIMEIDKKLQASNANSSTIGTNEIMVNSQ